MKRTTKYKIVNLSLILFITFLTIDLYKAYNTLSVLVFPLLLLAIINVSTKLLWRKFYQGRRLIQQKKYKEAIEKYESFLTNMRSNPLIKHLMFLTIKIYTLSLEAVTYNNIASCYINLSQLKKAKEAARQSLQIDELYAIPYYNLAIISVIEGNPSDAKKHLEKSGELGLKPMDFDAFQSYIKKIFNVSSKSVNKAKTNTDENSKKE
ncbi:MAG: tetratricopeptide repeat protein [Clostridia bacterium]